MLVNVYKALYDRVISKYSPEEHYKHYFRVGYSMVDRSFSISTNGGKSMEKIIIVGVSGDKYIVTVKEGNDNMVMFFSMYTDVADIVSKFLPELN